jgi:outer membrane protein
MRAIFLVLILTCSYYANSQEVWNLERCVQQALQSNFQIKQSEILVAQSKISLTQSQLERFPSLGLNSSLGFNFGRSVNPSTYTFETRNTTYQSLSANSQVTLYNGGRVNNTISQNKSKLQATKYDMEQVINTVSLSVAQSYLQVLLNEEQLDASIKRLNQAKDQLIRTDKLIQAGALAKNTRLDILAQLSRNEQTVVSNQNNVDLSYFNLKQLLVLDPEFNMKIEKPSTTIPDDARPELYILKSIYEIAVNNQPQIKAGDYKQKSAELGVKISKAGLLPSLDASGSLSSNYSNTLPDFAKAQQGPIYLDDAFPVVIGGFPTTIAQYKRDVNFPIKPYSGQLKDNFGQSLGVRLNIPIFENGRNKSAVQFAQLTLKNTMIENERVRQTLKSDIQNAIFNARAARKNLEASQKNVDAQKAALENLEKRYQIGATNSFEYNVAKTNYDTAENDLIVTKYDYLFKLKIIEFYQGKKIILR